MWNEQQLDEELTRPSQSLIDDLSKLDGDIMILGAGGKIGPTLSVMAKKACGDSKNVYAVSRFSDPYAVQLLKDAGVRTISADLTDEKQVADLPKAANIVYMLGRKFGTSGSACDTWQVNVAVPALVTRHFGNARYVVFSTGNVYPFSYLNRPACNETDLPEPVGEYAMSSLGRERIFEYAASHYGAKVLIYRLNYAIDLRYGVLFDLAKHIMNEEKISLANPAFNCVWQRYANEVALRALTIASEKVEYLNVTGPETVSVRRAALELGAKLGREVAFDGTEGEKALLSDASKCMRLFGFPDRGISELIALQAEWILSGGRELGKPTHFEEQKGRF